MTTSNFCSTIVSQKRRLFPGGQLVSSPCDFYKWYGYASNIGPRKCGKVSRSYRRCVTTVYALHLMCAVCSWYPYGTKTPHSENYCGSSPKPVMKSCSKNTKKRKNQSHPPKSETETWTEPGTQLWSGTGENFVVDVELHYHRVSDTFGRSKCILVCIDAISSVIIMAAFFTVDKISFRSKIHGWRKYGSATSSYIKKMLRKIQCQKEVIFQYHTLFYNLARSWSNIRSF